MLAIAGVLSRSLARRCELVFIGVPAESSAATTLRLLSCRSGAGTGTTIIVTLATALVFVPSG